MKNAFIILVAVFLAGCVSMDGGGRNSAAGQNVVNDLTADVFHLKSLVSELDESNRRLRADMDALRSVSDAKLRAFEDALNLIKQDLNRAEAAGEKMKSEIISDISKRIADLMRQHPPARSGDVGRYHVVAAGDTVLAIATAYGKSVDSIVKANNLKDANAIRVGQKLFIPE